MKVLTRDDVLDILTRCGSSLEASAILAAQVFERLRDEKGDEQAGLVAENLQVLALCCMSMRRRNDGLDREDRRSAQDA